MSASERINERGNTVTTSFIGDADRYLFDFKLCTAAKGWQQYDTAQDAWYFGVWVHLEKRQIVTYAEGDLTTVDCPTAESLKAELRTMAEFYGPPPPALVVIDHRGQITHIFDMRPELTT